MTTTTDQRAFTQQRRARRKKGFPFFLILSCLIHATLILLLAILFARNLLKKEAPKDLPPPKSRLRSLLPPKQSVPSLRQRKFLKKPPKTPFSNQIRTAKPPVNNHPTASFPSPPNKALSSRPWSYRPRSTLRVKNRPSKQAIHSPRSHRRRRLHPPAQPKKSKLSKNLPSLHLLLNNPRHPLLRPPIISNYSNRPYRRR